MADLPHLSRGRYHLLQISGGPHQTLLRYFGFVSFSFNSPLSAFLSLIPSYLTPFLPAVDLLKSCPCLLAASPLLISPVSFPSSPFPAQSLLCLHPSLSLSSFVLV